jgi:hypothetical protein
LSDKFGQRFQVDQVIKEADDEGYNKNRKQQKDNRFARVKAPADTSECEAKEDGNATE